MAAKKLPELQVLIPYTELLALLEASEKLDTILADYIQVKRELGALRGQFVELMEAFGELRDFVKD